MIHSLSEFKFFKSFRLPVESGDDIHCVVEQESDGTTEHGEYVKDAKLTDISVTGLGFKSLARLQLGDELTFSIQHKKLRFDVFGKIVRVMGDSMKEGQLSYGVEINEPDDRAKLHRFIGQIVNFFTHDRIKQCLRDIALSEQYSDMSEGFEMLSLMFSLFKDITEFSKKEGFVANVVEELVRVLKAQKAFVYLINVENNELEAVEANGVPDKKLYKFDFRKGLPGYVFTTGLSINIDSVKKVHFLETSQLPGEAPRSVLAYPLHNREDKVIGVLEVQNKMGEERFTEEDEKVFRLMALVFSCFYAQYNPVSEKSMVRRFSAPNARQIIYIGRSESTTLLRKSMTKMKDYPGSITVMGERGVGKTLYSHIIHAEGHRANQEFESIDCRYFDDKKTEEMIFGGEKDLGVLKRCVGGTVCLKDVSFLPMHLQEKLLLVLKEKGQNRENYVRPRIIFTTSRDLKVAMEEKHLHPDLFDEMSQFIVHIRPLRERKKDLQELMDYYLLKESKAHGFIPKVLSDELRERFSDYDWPGNVHELRNAISRLVLYNSKHHVITEVNEESLPILENPIKPQIAGSLPYVNDWTIDLKDRVLLVEREMVLTEIKRHKGNKSKAAKEMGISREALRKKLISSGEVLARLTGKKVNSEGDVEDNVAAMNAGNSKNNRPVSKIDGRMDRRKVA
ncbi:MAG: sigma 54-interacting transcriptional regulator [Bacteriovoracaceae bacterium]|nr:sigma 54-interacting transcriptional regulator [Bacteriovoracaceae bacterium]